MCRMINKDENPMLAGMSAKTGGSDWQNPLVKKGRLGSPLVEVTPFVFNDRLYRLENWQYFWGLPDVKSGEEYHHQDDEIRIRDVASDRVVSIALRGYGFGVAFVWGGRVHVFAGIYDRVKVGRQITEIGLTSSDDLVQWTPPQTVLWAETGEHLFNVGVCRGRDQFVLLYETDDLAWPPFTFKYCVSDDLRQWSRVPNAIYGRDKYVGGPALYYEGDYYYTLYLHDLGGQWETRVTRSVDLVNWQDAPEGRPFVTFDTRHKNLPLRPPDLREINASDAELCCFQGRTIICFTGGDQQTAGDLQWAEFAGKPRELLESFFK